MRHLQPRSWTPSLITIVALATAIVAVQLLPSRGSGDFRPFVMTIEDWTSTRIGYSDGTTKAGTETYRLEYRRRDDWTLTLLSDDVISLQTGSGWACANGTSLTFDNNGVFTVRSHDPAACNGVGRWIHYGLARSSWWQRNVSDGKVTYTSEGERIVFDLATGLPMLYEAGPGGAIGERTTFRLERAPAETGQS